MQIYSALLFFPLVLPYVVCGAGVKDFISGRRNSLSAAPRVRLFRNSRIFSTLIIKRRHRGVTRRFTVPCPSHPGSRRGSSRAQAEDLTSSSSSSSGQEKIQSLLGVDQGKLSQILTDVVYNTPDIRSSKVLPYDRLISEFVTAQVWGTLSGDQKSQLTRVITTMLERYDIQVDQTVETQGRVIRLETDEKKARRELRNQREKFYIKFTCDKCMNTGIHRASFKAWNGGSILATCHYCGQIHLIADNLGEMGFENFTTIADPRTQEALGKKINVTTIPDSRLLNDEQLAEIGLKRNRTTGTLEMLESAGIPKKRNIGFGIWDDDSMRPSKRRSTFTFDYKAYDIERLLRAGKSVTEAKIEAERREQRRENPWHFARALVRSKRVPTMDDAWIITESVFRETNGGIFDDMSEKDQTMLLDYQRARMQAALPNFNRSTVEVDSNNSTFG